MSWRIGGTGDFNGDGQCDIVWRNMSSGKNVVWFLYGTTYIWSDYLTQQPNTAWELVGTGDFNGDYQRDLVWRNPSYTSSANVIWYMLGLNQYSYAYLPDVGDNDTNWRIVGVGDFGAYAPPITDSDGDGLSDAEETNTYHTDPNNADTDGDGLTDYAEVKYHLTNPLQSDTDQDGISDSGEVERFGSTPTNAFSKSSYVIDSQYYTIAFAGQGGTEMWLSNPQPSNGRILFSASGPHANQPYELYYTASLNNNDPNNYFRMVARVVASSSGYASFDIPNPGTGMGYYAVGLGTDEDGDGLSDGYESLVTLTSFETPDSLCRKDLNQDGILDFPDAQGNGISDGDEDFDGDGLPSKAEYRLSLNTFVSYNPLSLSGMSSPSSPLRGRCEIPVLINALEGMISDVQLILDGYPEANSCGVRNESGSWKIVLDSPYVPSGAYSASIRIVFEDGSMIDGPTSTIYVDNAVLLAPWTKTFGDAMLIQAWSPVEADWEVCIYDMNNNLLGVLESLEPTDTMFYQWDFRVGDTLYDLDEYRLEYWIYPLTGLSGPTPPLDPVSQNRVKETSWSVGNGFVIAYGVMSGVNNHHIVQKEMIREGVVNILGAAGYSLSSGNIPNTMAFQLHQGSTNSFWADLLAPHNRHLYFHGHGNAASFGDYTRVLISEANLRNKLKNRLVAGLPRISLDHPYRIVFLDSCYSGAGNLSEAFGIYPAQLTVFHYAINNQHARAFIGHTTDSSTDFSQGLERGLMLAQFWTDWLNGIPLYQCVANAQAHAGGYPLENDIVIYGAQDLQINSP